MTDADDHPPPEIQRKAAEVQAWLDSRKPAQSQLQERAVDKFRRTIRSDTPPAIRAVARSARCSMSVFNTPSGTLP